MGTYHDDAGDSDVPRWLTAAEAAERLAVRRRTVYTYASRGWLRTRTEGRARRYHPADVERLRERAQAHQGRAPRAAEALRWGLPVIETAVGAIDRDGPSYAGIPALDLLDQPLEAVADRLWGPGEWPDPPARPPLPSPPLPALLARCAALAAAGPVSPRALLRTLAGGPGPVADTLAEQLGAPAAELGPALVLCVDHGLNASTFACRVAASTGASIAAAVTAALAACTGPRHGGAMPLAAAWLDAGAEGEPTVGFHHPLYPEGDPRAEWLIARARHLAPQHPRLAALDRAVARVGPPNLDAGLAVWAAALGLDDHAPSTVFAIGRTVGWVAHALEQQAEGTLLRPRARYVDDPW